MACGSKIAPWISDIVEYAEMQSNAHVYFQLVLVCSHCLRQPIGRGWNYSGHDCSAVWSCLDWIFWHFMRLCNPLHLRQVWRPQAIASVVYRHIHVYCISRLGIWDVHPPFRISDDLEYFIQCWLDCGSCWKRKLQEHRITEIVMKAEQLNEFLDSLCKDLQECQRPSNKF